MDYSKVPPELLARWLGNPNVDKIGDGDPRAIEPRQWINEQNQMFSTDYNPLNDQTEAVLGALADQLEQTRPDVGDRMRARQAGMRFQREINQSNAGHWPVWADFDPEWFK